MNSRRNWKQARPTSMPQAMQLCVDYARDKHHRSVDQIADLMGLPQKWRLYKWVEDASIPARYLLPFEHVCGINFVTQFQAHANHHLLVSIPTGRHVEATDLHALQTLTNDAIGALIAFAAGTIDAAETMATITTAMEGLAWHRANVEKHQQPELELEGV